MTIPATIPGLLASIHAEDPAILSAGMQALTHGQLRVHGAGLVAVLQAHGVGRRDRVAIILPAGPELATAFLAIASMATAAPLNPALSGREFVSCLRDLGVRALLMAESDDGPARDAARSIGVTVLDVRPIETGPAGFFDLVGQGERAGPPVMPHAEPEDIALVLQTSGTTARPKTVPLSHRNLAASAVHIRETLRLEAADRCLNIMPLFHIHGLVACLLAPLSAGGSVFCTPGFSALRFRAQLQASGATWYSAVPTMHQAILARAGRSAGQSGSHSLRFIRSSSASLPPSVFRDLESVFGVPVIEAYGMTEAAHQMASNPLPPGIRTPGTVGPAAGPEVAIMDENGDLLPANAPGEIVIRGPNVFSGYEARPEANAESFSAGWFRTGDQGVIEDSGCIRVTGRLKEIINRGGEKISPREIEEVLLEHGAVRQAVAFSMPHALLGETVGAAVVLNEGTDPTEREILAFVADRLAAFKVPSTLRFVDDLPRGATGKVQRIGMARQLGLA